MANIQAIRQENKKELMLQALKKSMGNVSEACKMVSITRPTHYNWMRSDEAYRLEVMNVDEEIVDFVESALYKKIAQGETVPIIFFLKSKGKHRGWIERQETENIGEPQIVHVVDEDDYDDGAYD